MSSTDRVSRLGTLRLLPWFLALMGAVVAGLWMSLLITGSVPEIEAGDLDIWFHVVAELVTAVLLITSGVLMLRRERLGDSLTGIALGALFYTGINSAGFYADEGDWVMVAMFGVVVFATVVAVVDWVGRSPHLRGTRSR